MFLTWLRHPDPQAWGPRAPVPGRAGAEPGQHQACPVPEPVSSHLQGMTTVSENMQILLFSLTSRALAGDTTETSPVQCRYMGAVGFPSVWDIAWWAWALSCP